MNLPDCKCFYISPYCWGKNNYNTIKVYPTRLAEIDLSSQLQKGMSTSINLFSITKTNLKT